MIRKVLTVVLAAVISLAVLWGAQALSERIAENAQASEDEKLLDKVMPGGGAFREIGLEASQLPESVTRVYAESEGGYVFELTVTGYYPGMVILCGVDGTGTVTGAECIESSESLGKEKTYGERAVGLTIGTVDELAVVTGATKTTKGYKKAIKDALEAYHALSGAG